MKGKKGVISPVAALVMFTSPLHGVNADRIELPI